MIAEALPLGKVLREKAWHALELRLLHASKKRLDPGGALASTDFESRPHFSFFIEPPPVEHAKKPDYQARRSVEAIFEQVRAASFAGLPSRKTALFCSISEEDARKWIDAGASRAGGGIYEVRLVDESTVLLVDFLWFNYAVRLAKNRISENCRVLGNACVADEIRAAAREYWSGSAFTAHGGPPQVEALIEGSVLVGNSIGGENRAR